MWSCRNHVELQKWGTLSGLLAFSPLGKTDPSADDQSFADVIGCRENLEMCPTFGLHC